MSIKKEMYFTHSHSSKVTIAPLYSAQYCRFQTCETYSDALMNLLSPNYSTMEQSFSFCSSYPELISSVADMLSNLVWWSLENRRIDVLLAVS